MAKPSDFGGSGVYEGRYEKYGKNIENNPIFAEFPADISNLDLIVNGGFSR